MTPLTRRRWRRLLAAVAAVGLLLALLHAPPVRQRIGQALAVSVSEKLGAEVLFEDLDWNLFRLAASVRGVKVRAKGFEAQAAEVRVTLDTSRRVHVRLSRLEITLRPDAGEENQAKDVRAPRRPWAALDRLAGLDIESAVLRLGPDARVMVSGLDARVSRDGAALALVASGQLTALRDATPSTLSVEATLRAGEILVIERLQVRSNQGSLEARGRVETLGPLRAALDGALTLDLALLAQAGLDTGLAGRVAGPLTIVDDLLRLEARAEAVRWRTVGPLDGRGALLLRISGLALEQVALAGYGGQARLDGSIPFGPGRSRLRIAPLGLDAAALLRDLTGAELSVASRGSGQVDVQFGGGAPPVTTGRLRLAAAPELPGLPLSGPLRVTTRGAAWRVDLDEVTWLGGGGRGHLAADATTALTGSAVVDALDLSHFGETLQKLGADIPDTRWLQGHARADVTLSGVAAKPVARFQVAEGALAFAGLDVAMKGDIVWTGHALELSAVEARAAAGGSATLAGTLAIAAPARWDLAGEVKGLNLGPLANVDAARSPALDATGRIEGDAGAPRWSLEARVPTGEGALRGTASGDFESISASDLHAEAVPLAALRALLGLPDDLDGTLAGSLSLSGAFATPRGQGQLAASDLRWRGAALPDAAASLTSDGATARLEARWPREWLRAEVALAPGYALQAQAELAALPVAELTQAFPRLANAQLDLQGRAHFAGSLIDLAAVRTHAEVAAFELSTGGVVRRAGPFRLDVDRGGVDIAGLAFADGLAIDGRVPFSPAAPLSLHVRGTPALAWARLAFEELDLDGTAALDVRLSGTGERPRVFGRVGIELRAGRAGALAWDSLELTLAGEGDRIAVETARAALLGGFVSATGTLPLPGPARGAPELLDVKLSGLDLFAQARPAAATAAATAKAPRVRGMLEGSAQLQAGNWDLEKLQVAGLLGLEITRGEEPLLRSLAPARVRVEAGRATLEAAAFEGPAGRLEASATLPLVAGAGRGLQAAIAGPVDVAIFNPLLAAWDLTAAGTAALDLRFHSEGRGPVGGLGTIVVHDARVALHDPPTSFTELQAALQLAGTRVTLQSLTARVGGGRFTAQGEFDAADGRIALTGAAERVALTALEGVSAQLSGPLSLTGDRLQLKLAGDLEILGGLISREFDAASESLTTLDWQLRSLRGASPADRLALDLRLRSTEDLRVRNSLADVLAGGTLTVRGTLGSYLVDGGFDVRQGGTVWLGTTRTQTQAGRVALAGYPLRAPELDLGLFARVSGIGVEVDLGGTTDNMKTELRAPDRPELNESDLTSLLLTGRVLEQAAQEGGEIAAEQIAAALGSRLQSRLGDRFEVEVASGQDVFARDDDPNTRVRASRLINERTKVSYTVGIDGEDQQWAVEWQPVRHLHLLGMVHDNDAVSFEASHRLTLNLPGRTDIAHETAVSRVAEVLLEGDTPLPVEEMRRQLKVKSGRTFDPWEARADAERLRSWLGERGFRSALVEVEERRSEARRVDLRYLVRAGDLIRFQWEGDALDARLVRLVESGWDAYRAPERLPAELANRARHELLAAGYPDATVEARSRLDGEQREVVMTVTKGPQVAGLALEFPGRAAVPEEQLLARLPEPGSAAFYALLEDASRLALTLRLPYAQQGLLDVVIGPAQRPPRAPGAPPRIVIPIVEPAPDRIVELRLPALPEGALPLALRLQEGGPFKLADFEADRGALARHYQEQGYLDVRVRARLENASEPGAGIRLVYEVEPGPQLRAGAIRIEARGRSRDHVVRRLLTIHEGDVLRPSALADSRRRLGQLPTARSVDLRLVASSMGDDHRDVIVDVAERPDLELRYGVRWNSGDPDADAGTDAARDPSVEWGGAAVLANPFGHGLRFGGFAALRGDAFDFGAKVAAFNAFGWKRITAELFLRDRSEDEEEDYEGQVAPTRTRSATAMLSRYFRSSRLRLQGSYALSHETQQRESGEQVLRRGGLRLGLVADRRDSFIDPWRGHFASANASVFSEALGSDLTFTRHYAQAFVYVPLGRATWASAARLGLIPGERQLFDDDDLFITGGPSTVRAFELDDLAPIDERGVPGGQALAVFNTELRVKAVGPVQLAAFWDAGNAFATVSDASVSGLRMDAGLGARIVLSFGVLRLDWARLLDPEPGESKSRWVFAFGQPF